MLVAYHRIEHFILQATYFPHARCFRSSLKLVAEAHDRCQFATLSIICERLRPIRTGNTRKLIPSRAVSLFLEHFYLPAFTQTLNTIVTANLLVSANIVLQLPDQIGLLDDGLFHQITYRQETMS